MNHEQIRFIERLAAKAWRPETEQPLDGWRLRYTQGVTRRGNSVFPIESENNILLEEKITRAEAFYAQHGEPPCFQMTEAAQPAGLANALAERGYQDAYHTQVQTAQLAHILEITNQPPKYQSTHQNKLFDDWFNLYVQTSGYEEHSAAVRRGILSRVPQDANFLLLSNGDDSVAVGLGVAENGWVGIYCMVTHENYRRKGAATQVLHDLAKWGEEQKASQMYLQVMENNPAGLALYAKAGFNFAYQYWYSLQEKPHGD
jgi:ribosomal protein S18 acetylase RimI-like enzyme